MKMNGEMTVVLYLNTCRINILFHMIRLTLRKILLFIPLQKKKSEMVIIVQFLNEPR